MTWLRKQSQTILYSYFTLIFTVIPTDGQWSSWSEWGTCTVSCGTGKQSRVRTCTDPKPAHGGRFCKGYPVEWRPCFTKCPGKIIIVMNMAKKCTFKYILFINFVS